MAQPREVSIELAELIRARLATRSEYRGECLNWTGPLTSLGYGKTFEAGRHLFVHRVAWTLATGRVIGEGLVIDHTCFNRRCINPEHLEAVTQAENVRRAAVRRRGPQRPSISPYEGKKATTYKVRWRDWSTGERRYTSRTFSTLAEAQQFSERLVA